MSAVVDRRNVAESSNFDIVNNVNNYQELWMVYVDGITWYSTKYHGTKDLVVRNPKQLTLSLFQLINELSWSFTWCF